MASHPIIDLMEMYVDFDAAYPESTLNDFFRYRYAISQSNQEEPARPMAGRLGKLLGRLYRFSSAYSKKVLQPLAIGNMDNFMYLAAIKELGNPTKSDLVSYCQSEFTSGIAIIQRLVRQGWIFETADTLDARSKRVSLTSRGTQVLQESFSPMAKVGKVVFHGFGKDEMQLFMHMASRLDRFHTHLGPLIKKKNMDEILELAQTLETP